MGLAPLSSNAFLALSCSICDRAAWKLAALSEMIPPTLRGPNVPRKLIKVVKCSRNTSINNTSSISRCQDLPMASSNGFLQCGHGKNRLLYFSINGQYYRTYYIGSNFIHFNYHRRGSRSRVRNSTEPLTTNFGLMLCHLIRITQDSVDELQAFPCTFFGLTPCQRSLYGEPWFHFWAILFSSSLQWNMQLQINKRLQR